MPFNPGLSFPITLVVGAAAVCCVLGFVISPLAGVIALVVSGAVGYALFKK